MLNKIFVNRTVCKHLFRRSFSSATLNTVHDNISKKPAHKKPFIKNLLAGVYDQEFLIYPELTYDKLQKVENKYLTFSNNSSDLKESISKTISVINPENFGENDHQKNLSELTRLSEAISSLPSSLLIEIQNICLNKIILKYCTEGQKQKYMPLLKGDKSIAYSLSEDNCGSDPSSITTLAVQNKVDSSWTINGCKSWVTNAEFADYFLVFSKIKLYEKSPETKELGVFIIDKKTPGVSVEKVTSFGLEECGIGRLSLENVKLTDNDIVGKINNGYDIAVELLSSYKYSYASCFSTQLKNLLHEAVKFLKPRKQLAGYLTDCELIKKKISDVFLTIYILDSMLYLTAGMMDNFDIETSIESAIIHLFCIQQGIKAVENCMELLGSRAYDKSLPYYKISKDLKESTSVLFTKDICKLYISLTSIQHAAIIKNESIMKLRNFFNFPSFVIKKMVSNYKQARDSPRLNLNLYANLHPSLQYSSNHLEYCVLRIQFCIEHFLVQHGSEIKNRQLDLERIAEVLVDIYGMTAVLARASRSYCTGVKFADDEMALAKTFCQDAFVRSKMTINNLIKNDVMSNDLFHFKIADRLMEQGGYFVEHPLTQNIG